MTFRESDGCIVLKKPEDQSGGAKPGNAGGGKAARPTRDSDRAPSVLRDGITVLTRLFRITSVGDKWWLGAGCWKAARPDLRGASGSIGHGYNIVTPPKETGGQQGTQTLA